MRREQKIISILFLFSLIVRLFHAYNRSLFYPDEGTYALEAIWLLENKKAKFETWSYLLLNNFHEGVPFTSLKPLHNIFTAFFFKIFGINDFSSYFYVSLFGSLSVIIVFMISRKLLDETRAICSALVMAFLGAHVYYSATLLTEVVYIFFMLLSMYFYIRRSFFMVGIIVGLAFGIRYSAVVLLLIFALLLILENRKPIIKGISIIFIGFLTVIPIYFLIYKLFGLNYKYFLLQRMSISPFLRIILDLFGVKCQYLNVKMLSPLKVILALSLYSLLSYPAIYILGFLQLKKLGFIEKFTILYLTLLFIFENDINRAFIIFSPLFSILTFKYLDKYDLKYSYMILVITLIFSIPALTFTQNCYEEASKELNSSTLDVYSDNCNVICFYLKNNCNCKFFNETKIYNNSIIVLSDEIARLRGKPYNIECKEIHRYLINTEPWKINKREKYLRIYRC